MNHGKKGAVLADQSIVNISDSEAAKVRRLVASKSIGATQEEKIEDTRELISALGL